MFPCQLYAPVRVIIMNGLITPCEKLADDTSCFRFLCINKFWMSIFSERNKYEELCDDKIISWDCDIVLH